MELLTLQEAVDFLKISKSTIRLWEKNGHINSIRTIGKHRRYDKKELDRVLYGEPQKIS